MKRIFFTETIFTLFTEFKISASFQCDKGIGLLPLLQAASVYNGKVDGREFGAASKLPEVSSLSYEPKSWWLRFRS